MDAARLEQTIKHLLQPGKGILAADESTTTAGRRLAKIKLENTELNRHAYRLMLLSTPGLEQYISGVILVDETTRQKDEAGLTFPASLTRRGIVAGIKVDRGLKELPDLPGESLALGLDDLAERLSRYSKESEGNLRFTKWRQTISIGTGKPSSRLMEEGMKRLTEYAVISQEHGFVPIVEPEVLMDGDHDGQRCEEVTRTVLSNLFRQLAQAKVTMKYVILKPNMIVPGASHPKGRWIPEQVGARTHAVLHELLPIELPGVAFLSGGMAPRESTANLNAIVQAAQRSGDGRTYTFSFGRALQDRALKAWAGRPENIPAARKKLLEDGEQNGKAQSGRYDPAKDPREE
jgi:fructose-bisphosphate aldolase class I